MGPSIKKEILIGAVTGLIANAFGVLLFFLLFLKGSLEDNLLYAYRFGELGKIIAIGAIPNLPVFFLFLKNKRLYRARGVLLITILMAIGILLLNLTTG
ncbi:MAG TPA: hypothetical protein VKX30_04840 [Flavobacteriaceae bacterium]|nr:hypothetical protein [Flavobacteriaceae bacterium]